MDILAYYSMHVIHMSRSIFSFFGQQSISGSSKHFSAAWDDVKLFNTGGRVGADEVPLLTLFRCPFPVPHGEAASFSSSMSMNEVGGA